MITVKFRETEADGTFTDLNVMRFDSYVKALYWARDRARRFRFTYALYTVNGFSEIVTPNA
jgi:hypothetical protein